MLYTVTCPLYGRLYAGDTDVEHLVADRGDIRVELRTSSVPHPGRAVRIDVVAMTTRVPAADVAQLAKEVGTELQEDSINAKLRRRMVLELQTFESGFGFAFSPRSGMRMI